jgi:hypothetical protein
MVDEGLIERLLRVENRLSGLEEALKRPFYKDARFWAGVITIPSLVIAGWIGDFLAFEKKPALLGALHRAVGTQPVIQDAITQESDPLRREMLGQFAKTFAKKEDLQSAISAELMKRINILHAQMLQIGLVRSDRIRMVSCRTLLAEAPTSAADKNLGTLPDQSCEDTSDAWERTATAVFGLKALEKINIDIGVHVSEFPRTETGALAREPRTPLNSPRISDLIHIEIDENKIDLKPQHASMHYRLGPRQLTLYHLRGEEIELSKAAARHEFPMHTLSAQVKDGSPDNYIYLIAIIVTAPPSKL